MRKFTLFIAMLFSVAAFAQSDLLCDPPEFTQPTCETCEDGTITVAWTGSDGPFAVIFQGVTYAPVYSPQVFTDLSNGEYVYQVYDQGEGFCEAQIILGEGGELECYTSTSDPSSNGWEDGEVTISMDGGEEPYIITWNGDVYYNVYENPWTVSYLGAGTYFYSVESSDELYCEGEVTLVDPPPVIPLTCLPQTVNDPTYHNGNDGSVIISWADGNAPYDVFFDGNFFYGVYDTYMVFNNLTAGSYSWSVNDFENLCSDYAILINPPPLNDPLACSPAIVIQPNCFGDYGSVTVSWVDGVEPYTVVFDGTNYPNAVSPMVFSNLPSGNYIYTVSDGTDACGSNVTLINPAPMLGFVRPRNPTCFGSSNGVVSLGVQGGTAPYTYLWSNGATTQNITGVPAGTYSVVVTDSKGCIWAPSAVTLTDPAEIVANLLTTDPSCFGDSDGTIVTTVTGGSGSFTYLWNDGATTKDRTGLSAGSYSVIVTETGRAACEGSGATSLTEPAEVFADAGADAYVMYGYMDEDNNCTTLTGVGSGGTAPYTYSWSDMQNGASIEACPGATDVTYTLTVTDANGCYATDDVTVYVEDITCEAGGSDPHKVLICHKEDGNNPVTLCVDESSVATHINHGDGLGACTDKSGIFIPTNDGVAKYYDLTGRELSRAPKGMIYIELKNGVATKKYIK